MFHLPLFHGVNMNDPLRNKKILVALNKTSLSFFFMFEPFMHMRRAPYLLVIKSFVRGRLRFW